MKYFHTTLEDLKKGENLDLYITLFAAISVAILNLFGAVSQTVIDSLTLAVLALLISSILGVRHRLEALQQQLGQGKEGIEFGNRRSIQEIPFDKRFADATSIDLHGYSLVGIAGSYLGFLGEKASNGCKIRILLLDPKSSTPELVASLTEAKGHLKSDILRSVESFSRLLDAGDVELRFTAVPTPFGLAVSTTNKTSARVEVDLYAHEVFAMDRPKLVFTREANAQWYNFFVQQFNAFWEDAIPYEG